MRLNLSQARLGKTTRVAEGVFVIKTMVGIGDGGGHLTHDGLRQRFLLNLQDGREEEILQVFCLQRLTEPLHLVMFRRMASPAPRWWTRRRTTLTV